MSDQAKSEKEPRSTAPSWLEWIQKWERAIGEPVEQFVRSDAYFDLMTQVKRARAHVTRKVEGAWEEWLHLFNLPAATDVRRLREQLSRLERQVNRIAKDLGRSRGGRARAAAAEAGGREALTQAQAQAPKASEPDGS